MNSIAAERNMNMHFKHEMQNINYKLCILKMLFQNEKKNIQIEYTRTTINERIFIEFSSRINN